MAGADYFLCSACRSKTFYDADIYKRWQSVGDIKVICQKCAETHELIVRKIVEEI